MKIRSVGAELFHEDGRTDMTKLIVAFRNFANTPKNVRSLHAADSYGPKTLTVLRTCL